MSVRFVIIIVTFLMVSVLQAENLYQFDNPRQQVQFQHLLKELRCLVCQNQDLSDSNAPLARDLKNEVYAMVKEQQSDQEIINFLTERYGDFILFNPPMKGVTYFLWFGPAFFLLLGLWIFKRTCVGTAVDD